MLGYLLAQFDGLAVDVVHREVGQCASNAHLCLLFHLGIQPLDILVLL